MPFLDIFRSKATIEERWSKQVQGFANYICEKFHLTQMSKPSFQSATKRWQFRVVHGTGRNQTQFKLDIFRKNKNIASVHERESLRKLYVEQFYDIDPWLKYQGFLYDYEESVTDYVSRKQPHYGRRRESVVIPLLINILDELLELRRDNLNHLHFSWSSFHVDKRRRGKVGGLEYVVDREDVLSKDLSNVQHLPPEALRPSRSERNIEAEESWCLGDLLLNILLGKSISGQNFKPHTKPISREDAYLGVTNNLRRLRRLLEESDLSQRVQALILRLLDANPMKRLNLHDVEDFLEDIEYNSETSTKFPWFPRGREFSPERTSSSSYQHSSRDDERTPEPIGVERVIRGLRRETIVRKTRHGDYPLDELLAACLQA